MKSIAEKVALVAQICITLVFVLITVLCMAGIINYYPTPHYYSETPGHFEYSGTIRNFQTEDGGILFVLMVVLALIYVALSVYMLYVTFSERQNLKRILLFCDSDSATHTNIKVANNIVRGCSRQVQGIAVQKMKIRADEKGGFVATLKVKASSENVAQAVNKLRCLVADSFQKTLGLTFNTINIDVERLNGKYTPTLKHADELAEVLQEKQEECAQNYQEPLPPEQETLLPQNVKTKRRRKHSPEN